MSLVTGFRRTQSKLQGLHEFITETELMLIMHDVHMKLFSDVGDRQTATVAL